MQKIHIPKVEKVIVIAAGKGGVGKSTVATNLAVVLAQSGFKVGLLDADIYGPSISFMLGVKNKVEMNDNEKFIPHQKYGVKFISMGSLVKADDAIMWRGPMITKMLNNFLLKTEWGELDYLIIDTPPGTGDIHISLATSFVIDGALLITTAQKVAMLDVKRVFYMLQKLEIRVLGLIENMSYQIENNEEKYLFGNSINAEDFAKELNINLVAKIPFRRQISESSDNGVPAVLDSMIADIYNKIIKYI